MQMPSPAIDWFELVSEHPAAYQISVAIFVGPFPISSNRLSVNHEPVNNFQDND